ncbi:hypothetical protein [Natrialba aegyptia]|uniref:DUF8108 domain-containing protein n=1 Tax=Natrialba aegyptia DSM 13077 TaxID=1227491 RepID=M0AZJ2_9EURY|nr:hypothetical protein [Natrialba aegyptia]ELZ03737.1 hypothetical protein C480_15270 [Natrialba aegyptia DSM 13077]
MSNSELDTVELADAVSNVLYSIAGWLSIIVGLLGTLTVALKLADEGLTDGELLPPAIVLAVMLGLVALGIFVTPRFRRRLNRRGTLSQFGYTNSVDSRVIRPEAECAERCASCRSRIEKGLVRRYRTEFTVAGIPVYTGSEGRNHYCFECALEEVFPAGSGRSAPERADFDDKDDTELDSKAGKDTDRDTVNSVALTTRD